MDLEGLMYTAAALSRITLTPARLFQKDERIFYFSPVELQIDPMDPYLDKVLAINESVSYFVADDYAYYGIINSGELKLVLGPLRDVKPDNKVHRDLAQKLGVPSDEVAAYVSALQQIGIVPLNTTVQMLCLMNFLMTGEKLSAGDVIIHDVAQNSLTNQLTEEMFEQGKFLSQGDYTHSSENVETRISSYIRRGRPRELEEYLNELPTYSPGSTALNEVRNQKNLFISSATLSSRAAIEGGLDADTALRISDRYILFCESLSEIENIKELNFRMCVDFAEKVARTKIAESPSKLATDVANYVHSHMFEPISTEDVAKALFMSRGFVSTSFKQETGKNLADYIREEKVEEAKMVLRHSTQSLSDIASHLGFSSQSHFCSVFKRYTGMSPHEYRKNS